MKGHIVDNHTMLIDGNYVISLTVHVALPNTGKARDKAWQAANDLTASTRNVIIRKAPKS